MVECCASFFPKIDQPREAARRAGRLGLKYSFPTTDTTHSSIHTICRRTPHICSLSLSPLRLHVVGLASWQLLAPFAHLSHQPTTTAQQNARQSHAARWFSLHNPDGQGQEPPGWRHRPSGAALQTAPATRAPTWLPLFPATPSIQPTHGRHGAWARRRPWLVITLLQSSGIWVCG